MRKQSETTELSQPGLFLIFEKEGPFGHSEFRREGGSFRGSFPNTVTLFLPLVLGDVQYKVKKAGFQPSLSSYMPQAASLSCASVSLFVKGGVG